MKVRTILNIGLAGAFAVVVTAVWMMATIGRGDRAGAGRLQSLGVVPDFSLTEASGEGLRRQDLQGRVWIASFIFTRCATVCPMMMRQQSRLQTRLPPREDLKLVTFSVDPEWDSPEVLAAYASGFGADRRRWLFLTGDKKQIYRLAIEGFRLSTEEADPAAEMPILHSSHLVLVDRRGTIRGYYDSDDEAALNKLVRDVRRVLAERS